MLTRRGLRPRGRFPRNRLCVSMLVFCPWLRLKESHTVAGLKLVPYERGVAPFGQGDAMQAITDAILEPYVDEPGRRPIDRAVLIRRDDREWTAALTEDERGELFDFGELLAFAGLAARRYFDDGFGFEYASRDHYRLVVQAFEDAQAGVFVACRRRDGTTGNHKPKGSYIVLRPEHASSMSRTPIDFTFLEALLDENLPTSRPAWFEAILAFNAANTDSVYVSEQMEAVLTVGALERLLVPRGGKEDSLAAAFAARLQPARTLPVDDCHRLASNRAVFERFMRCGSVREAWIRDFFRARGDYAHGRTYQAYNAVWHRHEHLLLASYIAPRLLKLLLAEAGHYSLTDADQLDIDAFESLACGDLFDEDLDESDPWPWRRIRNAVWHRRAAARLADAISADLARADHREISDEG